MTGTNRSNFLLNYFKSNSEFNEISCFAKGWNGIFKFGCKRKKFYVTKLHNMLHLYSQEEERLLFIEIKMKYFWRKISKIFSFNYCLKKSRPLKALICLAIIAYTSLIDFCLIDTNLQSFPILSSLSLSSDVNWLLDGLN